MNESKGEGVYYVDMELKHNGMKLEQKLGTLDTQKKILVLIVCCSLMERTKVIRVDPEHIVIEEGKCYLTNLVYDEGFIRRGLDLLTVWLFSPQRYKFQEILAFDGMELEQQVKELEIPLILSSVLASYRKE